MGTKKNWGFENSTPPIHPALKMNGPLEYVLLHSTVAFCCYACQTYKSALILNDVELKFQNVQSRKFDYKKYFI